MTAGECAFLNDAGLDATGGLGHVERHSPGLCCVVTAFLRRCGMAKGPKRALLVWFAVQSGRIPWWSSCEAISDQEVLHDRTAQTVPDHRRLSRPSRPSFKPIKNEAPMWIFGPVTLRSNRS